MARPVAETFAPRIEVVPSPPTDAPPALVAILLHGGTPRSHATAARWRLTYLRVRWLGGALGRLVTAGDVALWRLRYRYRGWNPPALPAVGDAHWAVRESARRHPGAPVVLIGHSMGARAALRAAGMPQVTAVCALAPWLPDGEPVAGLRGRRVLVAHGDRDRMTDPRGSRLYARRAAARGVDIRYMSVTGDGHAMLRRPGVWHRLVADFVETERAITGLRRPAPRAEPPAPLRRQVTRPGSAGYATCASVETISAMRSIASRTSVYPLYSGANPSRIRSGVR